MNDNYEVGDRIYIFTSGYRHYDMEVYDMEEGKVASITATGRINVNTSSGVRHFMPPRFLHGVEVGSGRNRNPSFIRKKDEQEAVAEKYRGYIHTADEQHKYRTLRDGLPLKLEGNRLEILKQLAAIQQLVEQTDDH